MKVAIKIAVLIVALCVVAYIGIPQILLAHRLDNSANMAGGYDVQPGGKSVTTAQALTNSDPYLDRQWAAERFSSIPLGDDNAKVIVAVLDTGIDQSHEDLAAKVIKSINMTDCQDIRDTNGHGTHVAGIIAAGINNEIGISGVAPNALLMNVKVADDSGMVWPSTICKGIVWAVDNGAQVINMSLIFPTGSSELEGAIQYAWGKGVVVIAGAGNDLQAVPVYPACYTDVLAVAAVDSDNELWQRSNYGSWIDIFAPGVNIYSTLPDDMYGYMSGTSMSAAFTSGMAARALNMVTDTNENGRMNDEVTEYLRTLLGTAG
jgi:thermitase